MKKSIPTVRTREYHGLDADGEDVMFTTRHWPGRDWRLSGLAIQFRTEKSAIRFAVDYYNLVAQPRCVNDVNIELSSI